MPSAASTPEPPAPLVLGGDLGGTSTRIVVATTDGTVVGRGSAGGGNPTSHPASAAAALGEALKAALAGLDASAVRTAVIGTAGGSALLRPEIRAQFDEAWASAGLRCPARYLGDLEVAFASGTPAPDGTVLIAGTGSNVGLIVDHRLTRTAGGHGWLLGDEGSGFWLGREALRSVLQALDMRQHPGVLGDEVIGSLLPSSGSQVTEREGYDGLRDALIRTANDQPPVMLATLARAVVTAYDAGDPAAHSIVVRAAELLTDTVSRLRDPSDGTPLVLAGSVAGESSPVGQALREMLPARFAGEIRTAHDGVGGATWLALRALDPALATGQTHTRLTTPA